MSPSEQPSIDSASQTSARKRQRARKSKSPAKDNGQMLHLPIEDSFSPRHTSTTPRTANGSHKWRGDGEDEVQMSLLGPGERSGTFDDDALDAHEKVPAGLSKKDKQAMALLILLYLIQGVPLGLALGSVPFLLREHLSYTQLGVFTLSSYPYSLKLFWSPIVDSVYSPKIGRRKSWIVPMQFVIGSMMLWISAYGMEFMKSPEGHINQLTVIWTSLVFFAATQDIAVDGWALTLISKENISYASTAQTIGLNCGYFLSFTVFLALNSVEFATKYGLPQLTLERYLQFWAFVCYAVTIWLLLFKTEDVDPSEDSELNLKMVYSIMWRICKLKHVQSLCLLHFVCKIAFQANDAVTNLKLMEKGLGKEDLALAVLIDFPVQLVGGWLAASWAIGSRPLRPYLWAFWVRAFFAITATLLVYYFPLPPLPTSFFWLIVINGVLGSFGGTVQFVGVSAFHTRISDPIIGGTYMTLLNTASNLGGTWPRFFVLKGVDYFTVANCHAPTDKPGFILKAATECVSDVGKSLCTEMGGKCVIEQDGFYHVSAICLAVGVAVWVAYVVPTAIRLQGLPIHKWHVRTSS